MTLFLLAFLHEAFALPPGTPLELGPPRPVSVRFEAEVLASSESGRGGLDAVVVHVALPQDDLRQSVRNLGFDPPPTSITTDRYGNRIAHWNLGRMEAGTSRSLGYRLDATLHAIRHRVDEAKLAPLSSVPADVASRFLGDGPKYGLTDPEIIAAAEVVRHDGGTPLALARRANDFLRERLTYRNDSRWDTAPQVLRNGHASCSEYNFAFLALCRRNGLPGRYVGATALRSDAETYVDDVHHRWSEVFLPGHGWFPVDVSRNDGEDGHPVNTAFGATSDRLLVLYRGDGGDDVPLGYGYVMNVDAKRVQDGRAKTTKRFVWTRPAKPGAR